jgi:hypothetical protein
VPELLESTYDGVEAVERYQEAHEILGTGGSLPDQPQRDAWSTAAGFETVGLQVQVHRARELDL